ncbi:hypothetical protein JET14_04835 [Martelella lutilitoris]|uniref:Uncharacterized protein n=1 Tax=Martelella lutilitoris TaxID=2583532 RepID=A0A7T7HLU2_9HYPH|nr:hypothetical protein [Martelella lutilitoris]QQM31501.1 hypothetical protein JET14_04835 [Martelella lutilitoris]
MSFGRTQDKAARARNPFVRFAHGIHDFIETYQDIQREARRRYPDSFR